MTDDPAVENTPGRRADRAGAGAPGRRSGGSGRRRVDVVVAFAVALPAIAALSFGVLGDEELPERDQRPPELAHLSAATVVCPGSIVDGAVAVSRVPGVRGGEVEVSAATPLAEGAQEPVELGDPAPVAAEPARVETAPDEGGPVVISGRGAAAPGLVAGRDGGVATPECSAPAYDEWFVGVAAASRDVSTLELVNPESGPAVVEVEVYGPNGVLEAPDDLRSITVPGHAVRPVPLNLVFPKRVDLSLHLTVTRGRISTSVLQTFDPLGRGVVTSDYLLPQTDPLLDNVLLGVPSQTPGTLFVTNPGADEVRVEVKVVTKDTVFTPTGADSIVVGPHKIKRIGLRKTLPVEARKGMLGLLVTASEPVLTSIRTFVDKDIALFSPVTTFDDPVVAVLPEGDKTLLVGGAEQATAVDVTAIDADGKVVVEKALDLTPGAIHQLDLPPEAVSVTVTAESSPILGTVLVPGAGRTPGLGVVRLREAQVYAEIPSIEVE